jgi:PAS domain S-box-containing protein
MKIRNKILILLMTISIITVGTIGIVAYSLGRTALEQESFDKLTAVREMKAGQIEDYFQLISDQVTTLSQDPTIIEAVQAFDEGLHHLERDLGKTALDLQQIDTRLGSYYQDEYLDRLVPNLLKDVSVDDYWPVENRSRNLQDLYITSNPYDTGLKHLLEDAGDGSSYSEAHAVYHPIIRDYLERFGYYDIFLVDVDTGGHIVYTVFKEVDFGTSLVSGPYNDTNFARAYQAARDATNKDFVYLEDFEPYHPSYNAPASFIASPIYNGDEKVGVLVFQMPINRINDIMTNHQLWSDVGLGVSGETYLVGDDFLLRNQSRFLIEDSQNYFAMIEEIGTPLTTIAQIRNLNSTIGLQEVRTQGTQAAINGATGTAIFQDYRGVPVLSAYKPLNIPDVNWVIISEIDKAEAFSYIQDLGIRTLLVAVAIFTATTVASLIFSKTITDPLAALTRNTEEVAAGNLDVEIEYVRGKDEIGVLANSFSIMQDSIKGLVGDLEDINQNLENLVEERTKELELSELRSRSIIESAGEGIIVIDEDSKVILWNQTAEEMFGYAAKEIIGHPVTHLIPERYLSQHSTASKRVFESGQLAHPGVTHELAAVRNDGTEFPMELTLANWSIAGETYVSGILRDISERKEAEEALRQSNERVRTIVEIAPDAVIAIDERQTITLFNPKAEEVFGYSADDVIGQPMTMLMPEKSRSVHPNEINKFGKEDATARSMDNRREIMGQRKDGSIFPAEAGIAKMVINNETFFTTFFRDITERKEAEAELRRLSTALKSAADGVAIIDLEDKIQWVNPSFEQMTGYGFDEVQGESITILNSGKHSDEFYEQIGKTTNTGEVWRGEIIQKRKDGSFYTEELSITPILDETEKIENLVSIRQDVTERKELERQLEIANERMSEELNFARDIQMGLLPLIFPAFPTRSEFNIFAQLIPAREVGGDFYDFYFVDEFHLCFVVGDVSGKGAPGALLMAVSKTLIKSRAMDDFSPSSILTHVNNELSQNNESAMFVTVFLGIMDIRTGKIEYTNAGHNPPYIRRKRGLVEKLGAFHGPVIGAMPGLHYKESSTVLEEDDIIVVFSDGITEAMNLKDELYSDERLELFLATDNLNTPQKLVDQVVRDVKRHEGDAEQADDITLLAMKFTGKTDIEETGRLDVKIKNQITQLAVVEERFESFCQEFAIPDLTRQQVSMVLDEMLNNIVSYAYRDESEHMIDVEFVLSGTRLVITVRDDGVPFNPFALDPPNIALSLDDREVGGLGIYLVRGVMDEYMYNRHIGRNVVTLVKLIEKE